MSEAPIDQVTFDDNGLVPAVVQDAGTGRVLMVAYMNQESLERTLETGETWFWSRSREELWRKGESSGNTQTVREIMLDCDGDTVLVRVDQVGVACHTGEPDCFFNRIGGDEAESFALLGDLEAVISQRAGEDDPESSYTAALLDRGVDAVCKKVGEEATEVVLAVKGNERDEVVHESADLLYHLVVALRLSGVSVAEVADELASRRRSG